MEVGFWKRRSVKLIRYRWFSKWQLGKGYKRGDGGGMLICLIELQVMREDEMRSERERESG